MRHSSFKWLGVALAALLFVVPAKAVLLPAPGGPIAVPVVGGALSTGVLQFSISGTYSLATGQTGTYTANVYRDSGGPFGPGTETFAYQFTASAASGVLPIERVTMSNFAGFSTDVVIDPATNIQGAGPVASKLADSATRDATGSVVGFNFNPANAVLGGQRSLTMVIRTNATAFIPGLFAFIDGSTDTEPGLAPANGGPVPAPTSAATGLLVGLGTLAMAFRRWLKREPAIG